MCIVALFIWWCFDAGPLTQWLKQSWTLMLRKSDKWLRFKIKLKGEFICGNYPKVGWFNWITTHILLVSTKLLVEREFKVCVSEVSWMSFQNTMASEAPCSWLADDVMSPDVGGGHFPSCKVVNGHSNTWMYICLDNSPNICSSAWFLHRGVSPGGNLEATCFHLG